MDTNQTPTSPKLLPPEHDPSTQAVPRGWKTTEFYLSLAAIIIGALLAADIIPTDSQLAKVLGAILSVLAALGYTTVRGGLKREVARGAVDVAVAQLEALKDAPEEKKP